MLPSLNNVDCDTVDLPARPEYLVVDNYHSASSSLSGSSSGSSSSSSSSSNTSSTSSDSSSSSSSASSSSSESYGDCGPSKLTGRLEPSCRRQRYSIMNEDGSNECNDDDNSDCDSSETADSSDDDTTSVSSDDSWWREYHRKLRDIKFLRKDDDCAKDSGYVSTTSPNSDSIKTDH